MFEMGHYFTWYKYLYKYKYEVRFTDVDPRTSHVFTMNFVARLNG
jgi:hypothetical protein